MGHIGATIAAAAQPGLLYAERLLAGLPADRCARFARVGETVIVSNHPAFILGHLCLYPAKILEGLGRPPGALACPPQYEATCQAGVECRDDPDGAIYPPLTDLAARFFSSYRSVRETLAATADAALLQPNPVTGRMKELFPEVGGMLAFYIIGHVTSHLGQLSVWRRMHGLPAA